MPADLSRVLRSLTHNIQVHMRFGVCLVTVPLVKVSSLAHEDFSLPRNNVVGNLTICGDYIGIHERSNINL